MVSSPRYTIERPNRQIWSLGATDGVPFWKRRWLGPLILMLLITVFHFAIDPKFMFWHDLLRRAYYFPVIWVVYQSGLRGGAISSIAISAVFAVHLLTGWGHHLGGQMDQIYDIVGYLAVGFGVGLVVDRARSAAVAVAQRDWDVSLRGVISATIHELKKPKADIRRLAGELTEQSHQGMWEYSVGQRLVRASDQIDELRRDLVGIAKILSSGSIITKPFDWALKFANDQHLGGQLGLMVARTDAENPPPVSWPIPSTILDEVARCLVEDLNRTGRLTGVLDLTVGGRDGTLVIECSSPARQLSGLDPEFQSNAAPVRGWVRMKLLELTWSRYNGTVQQFDAQDRLGFCLTLIKPRISLSAQQVPRKSQRPARRIQESNRAYIRMAQDRSRHTTPSEEILEKDGGVGNRV